MNEVNEDVLPGPEKTGFGFAPLATAFWKHEDPYVNTGGKKQDSFGQRNHVKRMKCWEFKEMSVFGMNEANRTNMKNLKKSDVFLKRVNG